MTQQLPQPTQPQQAYMANGQPPQYPHQAQQQAPVNPMQVNGNAEKEKKAWATRGMAQAIASVLLIMSLLGVILALQSINAMESIRQLKSSFLPSSRSRGSSSSSSSIDDLFDSANSTLDSAIAQAITYLYILVVVCVVQTLTCIAGLVGVAKNQLGIYKVYHYGTAVFFSIRIILMFLLQGGWYMILAALIHAGVAYPLWAIISKWDKQVQVAKEGEVEMKA